MKSNLKYIIVLILTNTKIKVFLKKETENKKIHEEVFDLIDIYHPDCQLGLMYLYIMLIVFLTPLCWVEIEKIFFNKYVYRINNK